MYLVFARDRYYEVVLDGSTVRVAGDDLHSALGSYYLKHVQPEAERALAEWQGALSAFKEGTRSERFEVKGRYRLPMVRLTFPDGSTSECSEHECDVRIEEVFRRIRGAEPKVWQFAEWRESQHGPTAEERRRWIGIAYHADGREEQLTVDLVDWCEGVPLKGIAHTLNQFSGEGWTVVSTSEDKGLYKGADARSESYPSRMRFLLSRPTSR